MKLHVNHTIVVYINDETTSTDQLWPIDRQF